MLNLSWLKSDVFLKDCVKEIFDLLGLENYATLLDQAFQFLHTSHPHIMVVRLFANHLLARSRSKGC